MAAGVRLHHSQSVGCPRDGAGLTSEVLGFGPGFSASSVAPLPNLPDKVARGPPARPVKQTVVGSRSGTGASQVPDRLVC